MYVCISIRLYNFLVNDVVHREDDMKATATAARCAAAAAAGGMSIETTAVPEKSTARITLFSPKIVESFQHITQTT